MKSISDFLLYIIFLIFFNFIKILPYKYASNLFGKMFEMLGPKLSVNRVAIKNLKMAFPDIGGQEREEVIRGMWNNVGRMIGEFPNVYSVNDSQVENLVNVSGLEILEKLREEKQPTIIITAHFGNWEMAARWLVEKGFDVSVVYRPLNNQYIDKVVWKERNSQNINQIPKSSTALKKLLEDFYNNRLICMLTDQKQNTGIASSFFGHKAMTGTLPAKLAIKKGVKLVPVMVTRKSSDKSALNIKIAKPIEVAKDDSIESVTQKINDMQEDWIKRFPSEWFWLHKRWPKEKYFES